MTAARCAFLGCALTMPDSPGRRADAFEHDLQLAAVREGLAGSGVTVEDMDWTAPVERLATFDIVLLGTAWDYVDAPDPFLATLNALELRGTIVCNPPAVVAWNSRKTYLQILAARGVPGIPTLWHDRSDADVVRAAFDHFGCDRLVIKHQVGAGGVGQVLVDRHDASAPDWTIDVPVMLQPFLPSIQSEGEFSFVLVDGEVSHSLCKRPASGDYRVQSLYGGTDAVWTPSAEDCASAQAVVDALPFATPLYARIDMVRGADSRLLLMEAELIEPFLYPLQGPELGSRLAAGILSRLAAR